ncbi:MAG: glycosyltransferase family 4 protein, partial [Alphaproteobacteria bacterium]
TLPDDFDVFVGWSSASLEAIEVAKASGKLTVVERGSTHIKHQQEVLDRVYRAHGQRFRGIDPRFIDRECAEYETADLIAVPTAFAATSFVARGIDRRRLLVNPYGVDAEVFTAPERPTAAIPTVLFVGAVGFQKGAPDLLDAFASIGAAARLQFAGPLEPGWRPTPGDNTRFLGALDRPGIVAALQNADVFCLPSHQEGLSLSLLQAMSAGLPVVATAESGAGEVIEDGVEG